MPSAHPCIKVAVGATRATCIGATAKVSHGNFVHRRGGGHWWLGVKLRQIEGLLHHKSSCYITNRCTRDGRTPVETILCTRESEFYIEKVIFKLMIFIVGNVFTIPR